nr:hypothetical protein [Tanacetum cinerariifolium]
MLEDWGTNSSDSSIEFSFRTCFVAMEANGLGCGYGLKLVFPRLPSSSCPSLGLLTWDLSGCLRWIVTALIELWIWFEHCKSIFSVYFVGHLTLLSLETGFKVGQSSVLRCHEIVSKQDELPSSVGIDSRARLDVGRMYSGHLGANVKVTTLTTSQLVNCSSCNGIDMVIKDLDLKPTMDAMMRDFLE